jgi:hypothetical protein
LTVSWAAANTREGYRYSFDTNVATTTINFNTTLTNSSGIIPDQTIGEATRSMYKFYNMLGITNINIGTGEQAISLTTTPSFPTLIYTSYIDIISNKLSQFMRVKDSETSWSPDTSVITRIYLTNQGTITAPTLTQTGTTTFDAKAVGSRAFILNYTPQTVKHIKWDPGQSIIDFDIRVVDEFGDVVPWYAIRTSWDNTYFVEFFEFQLTVLASET